MRDLHAAFRAAGSRSYALREKTQEELDYEEGQKEGSQCNTMGAAFRHDVLVGLHSEAYEKGFQHGYENQPEGRDSFEEEPDSSDDDGGDGSSSGYSHSDDGPLRHESSPVGTASGSSMSPGAESDPWGVLGVFTALGLGVALLFWLGAPSVSRIVESSPATPAVSVPAEPDPWADALPLESAGLDVADIEMSAVGQLVSGDRVLSAPLLYADRSRAREVVWSTPSNTGRFRFVTLCGSDWCDDARLVDALRGRIAKISLADVGASIGVSWSPDDHFAIIKWAHAGTSGITALNTMSLTKTHWDGSSALLADEAGDTGSRPDGIDPSTPMLRFDMNAAKWHGSTDVEILAEVMKTDWIGGGGNPVSSGTALIRFSLPDLAATLVERSTAIVSNGDPEGNQHVDLPADGVSVSAEVATAEEPHSSPEPAPIAPPPPVVWAGESVPIPSRISGAIPMYPRLAKAARVQGTVVLKIRIGLTGRVEVVDVVRSIPLLDRSAVESVREWVYVPTVVSGVPVKVITTVAVNFVRD